MTGRMRAAAVAGGLVLGLLAAGCSDDPDVPMMGSASRNGPDGSSTVPPAGAYGRMHGTWTGRPGQMGAMGWMSGTGGMGWMGWMGGGVGPMAGMGWMGVPGSMSSMLVSSEADYLVSMVAHHQEAVDAARELERSDRPELREFGRRIVRDQSAQIAQMQGWLSAWYPDTAPDSDYVPMMSDLSGLDGDRLDLTFLSEMVHHHMMAVMMSRQLERWGLVEHPEVAGLARTVVQDQTAEIVEMQGWLRAWS